MDNSEESRGRVAIVEDDPVVREHLIDIISAAPRLDLAGVAPSVERGRALIAQCPDLFLLDIGLPDGNGLDLAREIKQQLDCRVLILTSFGDRRTVLMAVDAGADGYLLKDSSADFIRDGIEATLDGQPIPLDPQGTTTIPAPETPGVHTVEVIISDGTDTVTETETFTVEDPNASTAPDTS